MSLPNSFPSGPSGEFFTNDLEHNSPQQQEDNSRMNRSFPLNPPRACCNNPCIPLIMSGLIILFIVIGTILAFATSSGKIKESGTVNSIAVRDFRGGDVPFVNLTGDGCFK